MSQCFSTDIRTYCVAAALLAAVPASVPGQLCHTTLALGDSRLLVSADTRAHTYGRRSVVRATVGGEWLAAEVSAGQSTAAVFAEAVPEFDASTGLVVPLGRSQMLCASGGGFWWRGPTAMLLTQQNYESTGAYGVVGTFRRIPLSASFTVVPAVSYSRRAVRTQLTYLPRAPWQPRDSTAKFVMSAVAVGVVLVMDSVGVLQLGLERPFGMPTQTRFAPLGRENGENALIVGFGFAFPRRGRAGQ